jgi:hypothetical protein
VGHAADVDEVAQQWSFDDGEASFLCKPNIQVPVGKDVECRVEPSDPTHKSRFGNDVAGSSWHDVALQHFVGDVPGRPGVLGATRREPLVDDHRGRARPTAAAGHLIQLGTQLVRRPYIVVVQEGQVAASRGGAAGVAG